MAHVVVVGSINNDIVVRCATHPRRGETLLGSTLEFFPGGKGANQAVAAARAGAPTRMVARVGGDDAGRSLRDNLAANHVDVAQVGTCKHDPTGTAIITVADSGENTIVVVPGANAMIRPVHIDDAVRDGAIVAGDVVLIQQEIPADVVTHALRAARTIGARTVLNAAPARQIDGEVLALVDVLVVNETERDAIGTDARSLVGTVVVTLGAAGCSFEPGNGSAQPTHIPGHRVDVVDTTGAGDTFCGYLAAGLALGEPIDAAARRANAAGALACTQVGAQTAIPTADETARFLTT